MMTLSIVMHGCRSCDMNCSYCSAHPAEEAEKLKEFKADFPKMVEKIKSTSHYKNEMSAAEKENRSPEFYFDIWGGNPLYHLDSFTKTMEVLRAEFPNCIIHTSDNGLSFKKAEIVNFCLENKVFFQLSHDGCGQWIRSGEFDPLYDEETSKNLITLLNAGLWTDINCTLNKYNCSFINNIKYFNKWRFDNHIETKRISIKLNHLYPGSPEINKKNIFGHWQNGTLDSLKGTTIGSTEITGRELDLYMHEFRMLGLLFRKTDQRNNPYYAPYIDYIVSQSQRYTKAETDGPMGAACRDFQRGYQSETFVIDTIGEFCQCNLMDSSSSVENPGGYQADYCKTCKYRLATECNPCGAVKFPKECDFRKAWMHVLEEFHFLDKGSLLYSFDI